MTRPSTFHLLCVLTSALAAMAPAVASGADRQETPKSKGLVVVPVEPDESAPVTRKHTNVYDPLGMQAFSVALLLGEVHGGAAPDNVPEGAKKALADLREFLPYKSYRLLDTQWIRCCAGPNVMGRLRAVDEHEYAFSIGISSVGASKMTANFLLTEAAAADAGLADKKRPVISSNFSMETGETVVIGTSSLKGEKALVVLLTAVPRSGAAATVKKGSLK